MAAVSQRKPPSLLSIGQVLAKLTQEFPELSPSKLRFLEDQGLMQPSRTPSGYRKFSTADVERLRVILTLQRDHYMPLKVILQHLEAIDQGKTPAIPGANLDVVAPSIFAQERKYSRAELVEAAGASKQLLADAIQSQLLPSAESFDDGAVQVLKALVELQQFGIESRHLRGMRATADREAALIESAVKPVLGRKDSGSQAKAAEVTRDLASHIQSIRDVLSRQALLRSN